MDIYILFGNIATKDGFNIIGIYKTLDIAKEAKEYWESIIGAKLLIETHYLRGRV